MSNLARLVDITLCQQYLQNVITAYNAFPLTTLITLAQQWIPEK